MAGKKGRSGGTQKPTFSPKVQAQYRAKIDTNLIYKQLIAHIKGDTEMAATQVTAALGLLKKTLPDLSATEISGETTQITKEISDKPLERSSAGWLAQAKPEEKTVN